MEDGWTHQNLFCELLPTETDRPGDGLGLLWVFVFYGTRASISHDSELTGSFQCCDQFQPCLEGKLDQKASTI